MEGFSEAPQPQKKTLRQKLGVEKPLGKTLQAGAVFARLMSNSPEENAAPKPPHAETLSPNAMVAQEFKAGNTSENFKYADFRPSTNVEDNRDKHMTRKELINAIYRGKAAAGLLPKTSEYDKEITEAAKQIESDVQAAKALEEAKKILNYKEFKQEIDEKINKEGEGGHPINIGPPTR